MATSKESGTFDPMTPIGESEAVRDIYNALAKEQTNQTKIRASSFSNHETSAEIRSSSFAVPGGFRRQFVQQREAVSPPTTTTTATTQKFQASTDWLAFWNDASLLRDVQAFSNSDVDYGATLSPDILRLSRSVMVANFHNERLPLLNTVNRRGDDGLPPQLNTERNNRVLAGNKRTVFTIIKSFLGTAILFIPRGMYSAGLIAGIVMETFMALLSLWGMLLLLRTRNYLEQQENDNSRVGSGSGESRVFGYADVAFRVLGPAGKTAVEASIMLSQLGFCCVYFAFSMQLIREVVLSNFYLHWTDWEAGIFTLCISAPLVWIRHLKYLAIGNLISDLCIAFSLLYIVGQSVETIKLDQNEHNWSCVDPVIATNGTVIDRGGGCFWINPRSMLMFAGTSVYSFEGIAMVLPIQSSMENPQDMESLLTWVVAGVASLLVGFGGFCYYVYGARTQNVIINNMPKDNILTDVTKWMYLIVAIVTIPMCMFPAIRLYEKRIFRKQRKSGKKLQKSGLRTFVTFLCLLVAIVGGKELDHLVSVIGGLFSAPLALVFPPLLHLYAGVEKSWCSKVMDIALTIFGVVMGLLATGVAILSW